MAAGSDHQQVSSLAGHADKDPAWLPGQHDRLGRHVGGNAAGRRIDGVPEPLLGVIAPDLAQVPGWAAAVGDLLAWRQPGEDGDQGDIVTAGEVHRVAHGRQACRTPPPRRDPGDPPRCDRDQRDQDRPIRQRLPRPTRLPRPRKYSAVRASVAACAAPPSPARSSRARDQLLPARLAASAGNLQGMCKPVPAAYG
jgi:hypothetical protein